MCLEWVSLLGNALHEFLGAFAPDGDDHVSQSLAEEAGLAVSEIVL